LIAAGSLDPIEIAGYARAQRPTWATPLAEVEDQAGVVREVAAETRRAFTGRCKVTFYSIEKVHQADSQLYNVPFMFHIFSPESRNIPMSQLAHLPPPEVLEKLIVDRGEDFASLSRLLGRNAAYIQQFIKRGTPKKLAEDDRRTLARYFGIEETLLGAPEDDRPPKMMVVPVLDVRASAGHGAASSRETKLGAIAFETRWLKTLSSGSIADLSVIQVIGDSMEPTLADGDDVIVDRSDGNARLRDGIYVLRADDQLLVKRLARVPTKSGLIVHSDNAAYPSWQPEARSELNIVGRVLWFGRKVR
jgi:phage repressor protein C with HTH and peptisase S24 domain